MRHHVVVDQVALQRLHERVASRVQADAGVPAGVVDPAMQAAAFRQGGGHGAAG